MTPEPVCWPRSAQSVIARSTKESTVSLGSASWISRRPEPGWVRPSWSAWCQPRSVTSCCWVCAASPLELAASPAWQPELMLRTDAALEAFARLAAGPQATRGGAGACGGLGFGVLALGGRLSTGPALALSSPIGREALRGLDLVVTGCSAFDFASRGGGVVSAMAEAASHSLSPCIVIAGEVLIGSREMRAMGIEAAYPVRESALDRPSGDVSEEELATTARRVARSWSW